MSESNPSPHLAMAALRDRTLAELERQHRAERLSAVEYDRRVESAHSATSALDLRPLVSDLDVSMGPAPQGPKTLPSPTRRDDSCHVMAFMSESVRTGLWEPPEEIQGVAIMGGLRMDFREASLLEGVTTELDLFCLMGGAEIIVPPDIHVSVDGTGILGGFAHVNRSPSEGSPIHLHISGLAIMGGVDIKVREIGEDEDGEASD